MSKAGKEGTRAGEAVTNIYDYPFEYFDIQVKFAQRWSKITQDPLPESLFWRTSIHRRLFGGNWGKGEDTRWAPLLGQVQQLSSPDEISGYLWEQYVVKPRSIYRPPNHPQDDGHHFGPFSYDYQDDRRRIIVHFQNQKRGSKSDLAQEFLPQRIVENTNMFKYIQDHYPQAQEVIGGSWLYHLESYNRCWPPEFTANASPIPLKDVSFRGDSIWGQYLKADGFANTPRVENFLNALGDAGSVDQLLKAFEFFPLQPIAPIDVFYRHYGLVHP